MLEVKQRSATAEEFELFLVVTVRLTDPAMAAGSPRLRVGILTDPLADQLVSERSASLEEEDGRSDGEDLAVTKTGSSRKLVSNVWSSCSRGSLFPS